MKSFITRITPILLAVILCGCATTQQLDQSIMGVPQDFEMLYDGRMDYETRYNDLPSPVRDVLRVHTARGDPQMDAYIQALHEIRSNPSQDLINQLVQLMSRDTPYNITTSSILEAIYTRSAFFDVPRFRESVEEYRGALDVLINALGQARDRNALMDALLVFLRASAVNRMILDLPEQNVRIDLQIRLNGYTDGSGPIEPLQNTPSRPDWREEISYIAPPCQEWCRRALSEQFATGNPAQEVLEVGIRMNEKGCWEDDTKHPQQGGPGNPPQGVGSAEP